jgi:hypothetical protein
LRIMSAAFSAIMMTGALMFAPTSDGITEASTTRSASHPQLWQPGNGANNVGDTNEKEPQPRTAKALLASKEPVLRLAPSRHLLVADSQ